MPIVEGRIETVGALVLVRITPTHTRSKELRKLGLPVVDDAEFLGLLDTGASHSAIDPLVASRLSLESSGFVPIHTPSTGGVAVDRDSFDATIILGSGRSGSRSVVCEVIGSKFAGQGFLALIGRDVLSQCVLTYDGPADRFVLEY